MANNLPEFLPISELYPYEVSVITGGVKKWLKILKKGKPIPPINVLEVDDKFLVVNGNHRVMAAKIFGLCEIPVKWAHKSDQELIPYRDALEKHLIYKGYQNFPSTHSSETRRDEIMQEMKDINPNTIDNYLKGLQEKEDNIDDTNNNC